MRRSLSDGRAERRTVGLWPRAAILTGAVLSALPPFHLSAQDPPLNAGALFLAFPVGAHAVGMGQAAIAAGGTSDAAFWNPAGLATLAAADFTLHTATLAAGRTSVVSVFVPKQGVGVIGGAAYLVDYGDQPRLDTNNVIIGQIASRNFEFLASYATVLAGSVVFGVSYKLIQFRVDCSGDCRNFPTGQGTTHALDIGGQFQVGSPGGSGGGGPLRIGVALRNVGFKLQVQNRAQADPLPTTLAVGAQYAVLLPALDGAAPDERFDVTLAADLDSPWRREGQSEMRVGMDVGYRRLLRLRAGYAFVQDGLSGPSIGFGVENGSLGVDLARTFITGTDLLVENPTFFSFRVTF